MYFDVRDRRNNDITQTNPESEVAKRFQGYMATVLGFATSLVLNDEDPLPAGWAFSTAHAMYTAEINDGSGSASEANPSSSAEIASEPGEDTTGLGKWRPVLYLTSSNPMTITVAALLALPNGVVEPFGVVETNDASPIQVTAHPSTTYTASSGLSIKPRRATSSQQADMDTYCLNNSDKNELTPEYFWRQDNYQILINDSANVNKWGDSKIIVDWWLDDAPGHCIIHISLGPIRINGLRRWRQAAGGCSRKPFAARRPLLQGAPRLCSKNRQKDVYNAMAPGGGSHYYFSSAYNYFCTNGYIFWSGAPAGDLLGWNGYTPPTMETGKSDNSLVIVLVTRIDLSQAFWQHLAAWLGERGNPQGRVNFHDQYGNPGIFYLNFNFPQTYYPKESEKRSITPTYNSENQFSYFYDIIVSGPSLISESSQSCGNLYNVGYGCWVYLAGNVYSDDGSAYTDFRKMDVCGGDIGGGGYTSQYQVLTNSSLYNATWQTMPTGAWDIYTSAVGGYTLGWVDWFEQSDNDAYCVMAVPTWSTAGGAIHLRPLWTQNAFRLYNKFGYIIQSNGNEYSDCYFGSPSAGDLHAAWRFTSGIAAY